MHYKITPIEIAGSIGVIAIIVIDFYVTGKYVNGICGNALGNLGFQLKSTLCIVSAEHIIDNMSFRNKVCTTNKKCLTRFGCISF